MQNEEGDLWYSILSVMSIQAPQTPTVGMMGQVQLPVGQTTDGLPMLVDINPSYIASRVAEEGYPRFIMSEFAR